MTGKPLSGRALKRKVFELLQSVDIALVLRGLSQLPPRKVINPLFSLLYNKDQEIKWKAVTGMGVVVARLAHEDMESARVVMRRLMWNLNDESGGIGWGSPEAMGEILASHEDLAKEYYQILLSYAREDGNFQEQELMQRGVLWGIGRLSQVMPYLAKDAAPYLMPFLESPDATVRGYAAWLMALIGAEEARSHLELLTKDETEIQIYNERRLVKCQVNKLAKEALERLSRQVQ